MPRKSLNLYKMLDELQRVKSNNLLLAEELNENKILVRKLTNENRNLKIKCSCLQNTANKILDLNKDLETFNKTFSENLTQLYVKLNDSYLNKTTTNKPSTYLRNAPTPSLRAVKPMISGHTIERPVINLRRMNLDFRPLRDLKALSQVPSPVNDPIVFTDDAGPSGSATVTHSYNLHNENLNGDIWLYSDSDSDLNNSTVAVDVENEEQNLSVHSTLQDFAEEEYTNLDQVPPDSVNRFPVIRLENLKLNPYTPRPTEQRNDESSRPNKTINTLIDMETTKMEFNSIVGNSELATTPGVSDQAQCSRKQLADVACFSSGEFSLTTKRSKSGSTGNELREKGPKQSLKPTSGRQLRSLSTKNYREPKIGRKMRRS